MEKKLQSEIGIKVFIKSKEELELCEPGILMFTQLMKQIYPNQEITDLETLRVILALMFNVNNELIHTIGDEKYLPYDHFHFRLDWLNIYINGEKYIAPNQ